MPRVPARSVPRPRLHPGDRRGRAEKTVTTTFIEPGPYVRDGFAEGPLADAALSSAGQLLDELQEPATAMTDGRLRDGVYRALRHLTREQPLTCRVDSITALIRRRAHIDWPASDRLPCA
ncbi:hypothetical protein [Streptomyces sp. NPDC055607]